MNKLRLIRIYELRGKIHPIEAFTIDLLDGIEKEIYLGDIIRYKKGGEIYFTYYKNTNRIYFKSIVYNDFFLKFGFSYEEKEEIMKYLLEKHLNITINNVL